MPLPLSVPGEWSELSWTLLHVVEHEFQEFCCYPLRPEEELRVESFAECEDLNRFGRFSFNGYNKEVEVSHTWISSVTVS